VRWFWARVTGLGRQGQRLRGGKGKHAQDRGGPAVVVQPVRVVVPDHDRAIVYQCYYRSEFSAGRCPPDLAKKGNGCLPPGQAKKRQQRC
jgi:hypothetical protein